MENKVKDIINILEKKFPLNIKEEWDNVGLLVGDGNSNVKKIQVSLDLTDKVLENAIENDVDLIITHHPLIFKPLKSINNNSKTGKKIMKLIKNEISLYAIHTNLDSAEQGLNDYIARKIGGENLSIISPLLQKMIKIRVFVPEEHYQKVNDAVIKVNKFESKKYKNTYYTLEGKEFFEEKETATPCNISGTRVTLLEVLTTEKNVRAIITAIESNHPYEEPAYEVIELKNNLIQHGIGRYFRLKEKIMLSKYIENVKKVLNLDFAKAVYSEDKLISKIAIVNGSGASFIKMVNSKKIDLFITGDIKYHEALDAYENGVNLLDIGHYESEIIFSEILKKVLQDKVEETIVFSDEKVFKYV